MTQEEAALAAGIDHKRWQRLEREADADFAAGRVATFDDAESFLADLDKE